VTQSGARATSIPPGLDLGSDVSLDSRQQLIGRTSADLQGGEHEARLPLKWHGSPPVVFGSACRSRSVGKAAGRCPNGVRTRSEAALRQRQDGRKTRCVPPPLNSRSRSDGSKGSPWDESPTTFKAEIRGSNPLRATTFLHASRALLHVSPFSTVPPRRYGWAWDWGRLGVRVAFQGAHDGGWRDSS